MTETTETPNTLETVTPVPQYHFYRCKSCFGLLTADDEKYAYAHGNLCPCGGMKYSPANPTEAEWATEKVQEYCKVHDLQRDPADIEV